MCEHGDTVNGVDQYLDRCIAPLVKALNDGGLKTITSCCGHGQLPGYVVFADGRELLVCPDRTIRECVVAIIGRDIHGEAQ